MDEVLAKQDAMDKRFDTLKENVDALKSAREEELSKKRSRTRCPRRPPSVHLLPVEVREVDLG